MVQNSLGDFEVICNKANASLLKMYLVKKCIK
jgi:hypothetical protein